MIFIGGFIAIFVESFQTGVIFCLIGLFTVGFGQILKAGLDSAIIISKIKENLINNKKIESNIMRIIKEITLLIAGILFCFTVSANPSKLMNDSIALNANIEGKSTKTRLDIYEKISNNLDTILYEYPSSSEARTILSGESIGSFSPSKVQQNYILELTDYYKSTCKVSPSYTCLGYVSLNRANNLCNKATTFSELDEAYGQFNNSLKVFSSQNVSENMTKLTLTAARRCTSRVQLTEWEKGYYTSLNTQMLIDAGLIDQAKALVQETRSAYFKFLGVLALKASESDKVDKDYLSRLEVFIDEKIAQKNDFGRPKDHTAFLAELRLTKFAIDNSNLGLGNGNSFATGVIDHDKAFSLNNYGPLPCNRNYINFLLGQVMDYQVSLAKSILSSYGSSIPPKAVNYIAGELKPGKRMHQAYFRNCGEGFENYGLLLDIFGEITARSGLEVGEIFRKDISKRTFTRQELYSALITRGKFKSSELVSRYINNKGKYIGDKDAALPIFFKLVDAGKVCESSTILFQTLSSTSDFDKAVSYMLSSKNIDASIKHTCGDENLELLLS